jgi:drug/metabolite transporter (DMT)-like permease
MAAVGYLLCLLSGAAFGAMAIFGKLAYDEGIGVTDLLLTRFAMAALVLVALAHVTGALRGLTRPVVLAGLALGAIGYATQAGLYFLALERMDASVLALILYTYPALVTVAAIVLGRERASGRRIAAVGIASAGTVLVLAGAGAGTGALDPLGTVLGAGAALAYSTYILVGDRMRGVPPLALAALVTVGATATFAVTAVVTGGPDLGFAAAGWGWIAAIALVSTVVAVLAFFAGMERVGPSTASILSTFEPVMTIGLAAAVFGEALTALQGIGAAFVLGAVLVLAGPVRARIGRIAPAPAGS